MENLNINSFPEFEQSLRTNYGIWYGKYHSFYHGVDFTKNPRIIELMEQGFCYFWISSSEFKPHVPWMLVKYNIERPPKGIVQFYSKLMYGGTLPSLPDKRDSSFRIGMEDFMSSASHLTKELLTKEILFRI